MEDISIFKIAHDCNLYSNLMLTGSGDICRLEGTGPYLMLIVCFYGFVLGGVSFAPTECMIRWV